MTSELRRRPDTAMSGPWCDGHDVELQRNPMTSLWTCPIGGVQISDEDVARLTRGGATASMIRMTGCTRETTP